MSQLYPDLNLTNFPGDIDQFMTFFNITATDGPLIKQYMDAMNVGNTTLAEQILTQIPNGVQKIIKANDLNKLTQAMLAVERFYKTDIEPYIDNKQTEWLSIINQFAYIGTWATGTSYQINNMVSYTVSGLTLIYIAIATPPLGAVPTESQYWRLMTIQGEQGPSGPGLSYRQTWDMGRQYEIDDAVTYGGVLWMALEPSRGVEPGTSPDTWKQVINLTTVAYPIQSTPPTNQNPGDLWFNTQNNPTKYYYLESLANPAGPNTIMNGYEAYNDLGEKVTGMFETYTKQEIDTEKAAVIRSYPIAAGQTIAQGDIVDIVGNKITKTGTPTTAIALQAGTAGQVIQVAYSGIVDAPWVIQNQIIKGTVDGVFGFGILNGVLRVVAKQETINNNTSKIITGVYTGNAIADAGKPSLYINNIVTGINKMPFLIMIYGYLIEGLGGVEYPSLIPIALNYAYKYGENSESTAYEEVILTNTGFQIKTRNKRYSSGDYSSHLNADGTKYFYIVYYS